MKELTQWVSYYVVPAVWGLVCTVWLSFSYQPLRALVIGAGVGLLLSYMGEDLFRRRYRLEDLGHVAAASDRLVFLKAFSCFSLVYALGIILGAGVARWLSIEGFPFLMGLTAFGFVFYEVCAFLITPVDPFHRGRYLFTFEEAKAREKVRIDGESHTMAVGGLLYPLSEIERLHVLFVGATRSGKTLLVRLFMQCVIPLVGKVIGLENRFAVSRHLRTFLQWAGFPELAAYLKVKEMKLRAVVYDPKGTFLPILASLTSEPLLLLGPFDARGFAWKLSADVTSEVLALQTAKCLLPREGGKDPFWVSAARTLVAGAMYSLHLSKPGWWDLFDVLEATKTPENLRAVLLRHPETRHLVEQLFEPEQTFRGVFMTISEQLALLAPIALLWRKAAEEGKSVSLTEWVESGEGVLIIANDDSLREPMDAVNRAIFGRLAQLLLRPHSDPTRRTVMILDELREAGELPELRRVLNKGLEAGIGVSICAAFQDVEGLRSVYQEKEANEMMGAFGVTVILKLLNPTTSEFFSRAFGKTLFHDRRRTTGSDGKVSTTEAQENRDAVISSELLNIKQAGPENGVHGFALSPIYDAYRMALPWSYFEENLVPPHPKVPKFIPRETPPFQEWDEAARACFMGEAAGESSGAAEPWKPGGGAGSSEGEEPKLYTPKRSRGPRQK